MSGPSYPPRRFPPPGYPPPGYPSPGYPPPGYGFRPPAKRPSSGLAITGRVFSFMGITVALLTGCAWIIFGVYALSVAPLCKECVGEWGPPIAAGVLTNAIPLAAWALALMVQWRNPLLLLWSLLPWLPMAHFNGVAVHHAYLAVNG